MKINNLLRRTFGNEKTKQVDKIISIPKEIKKEELKTENLFNNDGTSNKTLNVLLGKQCIFYCINYIYLGNLEEYSDKEVKLTNTYIIYDTGKHDDKEYQNINKFDIDPLWINRDSFEIFGESKKRVK